MSSIATPQRSNPSSQGPEQLSLLPDSTVSPRFQLSHDTRRRGLRHVAEIRERLAAGRSGPNDQERPDGPARRAA